MRLASIVVLALACAALASPAFAQKEDKPGRHRGSPTEKTTLQDGPQPVPAQRSVIVSERDRSLVRDYYRAEHAASACPPGLVRKNNGCRPPGEVAKRWAMGEPLASNIAPHSLPPGLLGQLSMAPSGHQYVRVDNDILLMSTSTRQIVGQLVDLGAL